MEVPTTTLEVASETSTAPKTPSRILFGSCSSQHYEQVLWPAIIHRNATSFVWGGDAIYGECDVGLSFVCFSYPLRLLSLLSLFTFGLTADDFHVVNGKKVVKEATPLMLKELYTEQLQHAGYRALLDRNVTILGAMDDHDYGTNTGDMEFVY